MPDGDEVTAADIARMAGVGRAAVSNWRTRYRGDFPEPVGGPPTSPTFSRAQVVEWLKVNGKAVDADAAAPPDQEPRHQRHTDLAEAVTSLLAPRHDGLVLDPACESGLLLAAAARRLGPDLRYVGQDQSATNVAAAVNALHDAGARAAEIVEGSPFEGDALYRYRGAADAVICLPPNKTQEARELPWEFGPPPSADPYLAWMQLCYSYVKPGGQAIVATPYGTAARPAGRRLRAELLRSGVLRMVIALPERFVGPSLGPWLMWVLHRPSGTPSYEMRLVDLTAAEPDELPDDYAGWQEVYQDDTVTRDVNSIELLDDEVVLIPGRHIDPPVRDFGREYGDRRKQLAKAVAALDTSLPAFRRRSDPASFPLASVMELLRTGAISFLDKGADLEAGDVIVTGGSARFDASVASGPMARRERTSTEAIRCQPELIDPYFLACFIRSEANRRQALRTTLGGTLRLDLRRARIPRLPLADQRRYGEAFRRLTVVTDRLDNVATLADNAVQTAVDGLTSGVFEADDGP